MNGSAKPKTPEEVIADIRRGFGLDDETGRNKVLVDNLETSLEMCVFYTLFFLVDFIVRVLIYLQTIPAALS